MNGTTGIDTRSFGPVSACRIDIPEGSVRVEGTDEPTGRLEVRYLEQVGSGADPVADGAVTIEHHGGVLAVRLAESTRSGFRGPLGVGRRPRIALDLHVPRDASIEASTVGGDLWVAGCRGRQVLNTVTGGATVVDGEGDIEVRSIAGPIDIRGEGLDIQSATTSGRTRVAGSSIGSLRSRSVSGRIEVAARLIPGGDHRLETVSGDVELAMAGGTTLAHRTLSGRLTGDPSVRRNDRDGQPTMVLGDGGALVHVRTVSGDIRLSGRVSDDAPSSPAAPSVVTMSSRPDPMLEALEALARGDISVDEATRRLAAIHG
jgi:hypothetical protein